LGERKEFMKEDLKEMKERIKKALRKVEEGEEGRKRRGRGWWDVECRSKKRELRKKLRRWRKRGGEGEEYKRCKREYKELCKRKKGEENLKWEVRAREARKENEIWEIINWDKKRRRKVNVGLEWRNGRNILRVLGGVGERVVGYKRKGERVWRRKKN